MEKPSFLTRLKAMAQGEIPSDALEAYRRASLTVLELMERVELLRAQAQAEGKTAWTLPKGTQTEMLCAWNAFVLQSLGTEFLDADYRDDPSTVGFVPPITADQVMAFFTPVAGWVGRARQAGQDPNYAIDVPVPAPVPSWSPIEPCPNSHLHGMLYAMRSIRTHAEAAVMFLGDAPPADEAHAKQYHAIRGLLAGAASKAQYADDLHGSNPTPQVHEMVEPEIKAAIETFHRVGQFAAMPSLVEARTAPPIQSPGGGRRLPLPNEPGFDPWCLTDPDARGHLSRDREAVHAVTMLWRMDPDPATTLRMFEEIEEARRRGDVVRAVGYNGRPLGHFFCCPWSPVLEAARPITLAGQRLRPHDQFVYDVTAEGTQRGFPFRRGIKRGDFRPTDEFEYGDPSEMPDH